MKGQPFVVLKGKGNRAQVYMCSSEANRHQVFAGMKLLEAQAVCADLVWQEYDDKLYKHAQQNLCRQLIACSPKVTALEHGTFLLDATGLNYLGGEGKFCLRVRKMSGQAGYATVHVAIADSAFAAEVATSLEKHNFIVPAGGDASFLAPLSIRYLPIKDDVQESLLELGIRTMGQMRALSQQSLMERFGQEGITAYQLAQGIDDRQPVLPSIGKEFKSSVDLGAPIELLNQIQFVLKSMIDRLSRQLRQEGYWAEELFLEFYNSDDRFEQRPIKLLRPSNHAKFLLEVMKLSLEANPLKKEVTGIQLSVSRFTKESWQQMQLESLEDQEAAERESKQTIRSLSLVLMLQRFMSRLGESAVVRPVANDQYMPEHAGAWQPVIENATATSVLPVDINYINTHIGPAGLTAGLALRRRESSQSTLVEFTGDMPSAVTFEGRWYHVKEITQPERLSGLWWQQTLRQSYYVALLQQKTHNESEAPCLLVMLTHDHERNAWRVAGVYD